MNSFALLPDRVLLSVSGKESGSFLQGLFSQDVAKNFPPGKVVYGLFPNAKGRIIADAYVAHAKPNQLFLDIEAFIAESLLKHLNQYLILTDAVIDNLVQEYEGFVLFGTEARDILGKSFGIKEIQPCSCLMLQEEEGFVFFANRARFEEFRIWLKKGSAQKRVMSLEKSGSAKASKAVYEVAQIESGIPRLGKEINETVFPQEAGLEENIDFSKGCFVGAEVLQRIHYQGHVNRALALLSCRTNHPVSEKTPIFQENQEVGLITRSTFSPRLNEWIALSIVRTAALDSGNPLEARENGERVQVKVIHGFR